MTMLRLLFPLVVWSPLVWGGVPTNRQQIAHIGDFRLTSGAVLRDAQIGYRTFGQLNPGRTNAVLMPVPLTARSQDMISYVGGSTSVLDSTRYYVVIIDALGNGISSSPSTSVTQPDSLFPLFTIDDMVESQRFVLNKLLKIDHLRAVIGISMGGMQAFSWLARHPDFVDLVIPIVGTPRQSTPDLLFWESQLRTIELGQGSKASLQPVALLLSLHLRTTAYQLAHPPADREAFLTTEAHSLDRLHALDYAAQLRAMIRHDIFREHPRAALLANAHTRLRIIVATRDQVVNPQAAIDFAHRAKVPLVLLTGDCGHAAPDCERTTVQKAVARFLK